MIAVHPLVEAPRAPHVVFLHGLEGDAFASWGPRERPGVFQARLSAAHPGCATTTIGYPASVARFKSDPAFTLAPIEAAFGEALDGLLAERPAAIFVGYCLGGLLAALALRARTARGRLPPTLLFLMDAPLLLPERGDPYPEIGAGLGLTVADMADLARWLRGEAGAVGIRLVSILSEAPGWLAPYGRDAASPPAPLHVVPGDHLALAAAPATGDFAPLAVVSGAIVAFLAEVLAADQAGQRNQRYAM
ncbi:hypothetical protein ACTZWW_03585 [Salinarimonas sp. NSM]|uniref:hypothetical protein n=1 Tax=Salinarimonas sp. NSM TaxID=3458003 RepID=UPI004035A198